MEIQVSLPLAFFAGLVSFLSPCILPVVPSYLVFISGLTLDELRACLFFDQRAWRHFGEDPDDDGMEYIRALLTAIRSRVTAAESD